MFIAQSCKNDQTDLEEIQHIDDDDDDMEYFLFQKNMLYLWDLPKLFNKVKCHLVITMIVYADIVSVYCGTF